jgi:citrate lyase subunit beta/citryl-CoA lyase
MKLRSWLFVPGDSERKLAKAGLCGSDAVIVDLEDAVSGEAKAAARERAFEWLDAHRTKLVVGSRFARWVRINSMQGEEWRADLAAILPAAPDGVVLPKAAGPEQVQQLAAELFEWEERLDLPLGSTRILPQVGETPMSALTIADYAKEEVMRIIGLTWGSEDLAAAIGAARKRDDEGEWTDVFRMVRSTLLLTAHACAIAPIDTAYADFRDLEGLQSTAAKSRADGFTGMLAIHPDQVEVINAAFNPGENEIARAQAIVDMFADNPDAAVLQMDGRMVEKPHLEQARQLLANLD